MSLELTAAQKLLPLKRALGRPFNLLPYQSVENVVATDDTITLVLRVHEFTETYREVRFHKSGLRMYCWKFQDGSWKQQQIGLDGEMTLTIWDEDFQPYIECHFGMHRSVKEYYERLEREAMTYRPGTKRTPLDSFERATWGDTPDAMQKYWTGHNVHEVFTSQEK